jgi:hypothetical protein
MSYVQTLILDPMVVLRVLELSFSKLSPMLKMPFNNSMEQNLMADILMSAKIDSQALLPVNNLVVDTEVDILLAVDMEEGMALEDMEGVDLEADSVDQGEDTVEVDTAAVEDMAVEDMGVEDTVVEAEDMLMVDTAEVEVRTHLHLRHRMNSLTTLQLAAKRPISYSFRTYYLPTSLSNFKLPWSTSNQDLMELFTTIGKVDRAEIGYEPSGRSRGVGVVQFDSLETAESAITKFQGYMYGGRYLRSHIILTNYRPLGLSFVKYVGAGERMVEG